MLENVTRFLQSQRLDPLARQESRIGHLTEHQPSGECGHGKEGRSREHSAECPRKFGVGYCVGRYDIDGALHGLIRQSVFDRTDRIVDRYPAHVLTSVAQLSTDSDSKRKEHPG